MSQSDHPTDAKDTTAATAVPETKPSTKRKRDWAAIFSDPEELKRSNLAWERTKAELDALPPYNERQILTDDPTSGAYGLTLEYNNATNAKCRADKCLVEGEPGQWNEKIRSRYRFNVYAKVPNTEHWSMHDKPNRRFFHVTCLEGIGLDILTLLHLPAPIQLTRTTGKRFLQAHYSEDYLQALKTYYGQHIRIFIRRASDDNDLEAVPVKPKSSDFIDGEMIDRTLSDGLVDGIGGAQLLGLRSEFKISVLKVLGTVPPELKTAAIQAEQLGLMEAEAASEEPKSAYVEEVQDATADGKESIASASEHETDQLGIEAGHGEAGKQEDTVAATEYEESHSAESATGKSQNRFVGA